jgi:hypothetical protein
MRVIVAIVVAWLASADRCQAQPRPIDEFRIDKVGVGTSRQDFLKLHPRAQFFPTTDAAYGLKGYGTVDGTCISTFSFLDDELFLMTVKWDIRELRRTRGDERILDKIVDKYGKADPALSKVVSRIPWEQHLVWQSYETGNTMLLTITDTEFSIGLMVTDVRDRLDELKGRRPRRKID